MSTLLVVNSSPRVNSVSRRLTKHVTEQWKRSNPEGRVIERDLTARTPTLLSDAWIQATYTPPEQRTAAQNATLAESDALIDEIMAADLIVIGAPMHNFSISAPLKAWIDQIARVGKTFTYTSGKGPMGLLPAEKQVLVIVSRGAAYEEGSPADFQLPYLRHMLHFVGLNNLTVIDADKQAFGPEAAQQSIDNAIAKLSQCEEHMAVPA